MAKIPVKFDAQDGDLEDTVPKHGPTASPVPNKAKSEDTPQTTPAAVPPEPAVGPSAELTAAELEALHGITVRLERRWTLPIPDNSVFHAWDPLPWAMFIPQVRVAMQHAKGKRFMDVGCGIGTKLAYMWTLGWQVSGIDRHAPYIEAAKELIPEADARVADVLDVQQFNADIVYVYRPGVSDELEARIEKHIAERLAPGTLLFLPVRQLDKELGLTHVANAVWRK